MLKGAVGISGFGDFPSSSDSSRTEILRELDARLKESFAELQRWQLAVEGMARQFMMEGTTRSLPKGQTWESVEEKPAIVAQSGVATSAGREESTQGDEGIQDGFAAGVSLTRKAQSFSGRGAEATLQQLEADFAKLRLELKDAENQSSEGRSVAAQSKQVAAESSPMSAAQTLGVNHSWARPSGQPASTMLETQFRPDAPSISPLSKLDVEVWRDGLWRKSQHYNRTGGDVSRLYDELMRLEEEEEAAFRKSRPAEASKTDRNVQGRRRAASYSNIAARKGRLR